MAKWSPPASVDGKDARRDLISSNLPMQWLRNALAARLKRAVVDVFVNQNPWYWKISRGEQFKINWYKRGGSVESVKHMKLFLWHVSVKNYGDAWLFMFPIVHLTILTKRALLLHIGKLYPNTVQPDAAPSGRSIEVDDDGLTPLPQKSQLGSVSRRRHLVVGKA